MSLRRRFSSGWRGGETKEFLWRRMPRIPPKGREVEGLVATWAQVADLGGRWEGSRKKGGEGRGGEGFYGLLFSVEKGGAFRRGGPPFLRAFGQFSGEREQVFDDCFAIF